MARDRVVEQLDCIAVSIYEALDYVENITMEHPEDEALVGWYTEMRDLLRPAYYRTIHEGSTRLSEPAQRV